MELIIGAMLFIVISIFLYGRISTSAILVFLFSPIYYYLITYKVGDTRAVLLVVVFIVQFLLFRESEECK